MPVSTRQEPSRPHVTANSDSSARAKDWAAGRKSWLRNLPSLIALVAVAGCVGYCLGLTTNAKVNFAGISPTESPLTLRSKEAYQEGAESILNQSLLNRTKFTINTGHFEEAFREQFPEVADVAITLPLISRRPVVTVATAQPALILIVQNQAYVLDRRGMVLMKAEDLPEATRQTLPVIQDNSDVTVEVGKGALPAEDISFITTVLEQLRAKDISVQSITLPTRAHQVDMRLNGQPYYAKFSVDSDAREAAGTFLATKAKLEREKIIPTEYIDVRVDGRAYYK